MRHVVAHEREAPKGACQRGTCHGERSSELQYRQAQDAGAERTRRLHNANLRTKGTKGNGQR